MIPALRDDDIIEKFGGRFKLCILIQRRWLQLMQGARPMVETEGLTGLEIVIKEIEENKIELDLPDEDADYEEPFGTI